MGSGGREHALCWKIAQSEHVDRLFCAPGNPGTGQVASNVPIDASDIGSLLGFATRERIDLTVVGPEVPLCAGIADRFMAQGLLVAGPSSSAARLEGSKVFAKQFMARHDIPTAPFAVFRRGEMEAAERYVDVSREALVVKADGLAAGKGVYVCADKQEAKARLAELLQGSLGPAGEQVVVESKLEGEEASFIVLTDGEAICPLAPSQDHKAAFDGDLGPNTGGMGAYSPPPVLDEALQRQIMTVVIEPTVQGMAREGNPFRGVLYAGVMVGSHGIDVLEFNCRFGDPETQPLMLRLVDDLIPLLEGVARGKLPVSSTRWDSRPALCVVLAAGGYPGRHDRGQVISGVDEAQGVQDVVVFHAGTHQAEGELRVAGGRVLGVTAVGQDVERARMRAYEAVAHIHWEGIHYRRDIGHRAMRQG